MREDEHRPFDWTGFVSSAVACSTLMYGLELVGQQPTPWLTIVLLLIVSLLTGSLMVWHSGRHATPLISLASLRIQTFAITIRGGSLFRITISVIPFLLPLLFQIGFGLSAFKSGLLVLAVFAGNLGMKTVTTPVIRRFGFRRVLIGNGLLTALSLFACALLSPEMPTPVIVAILFFGGLCRSMQFTSLNTLGFADIPPAQMSAATTFAIMVQQMTMGMGVAVRSDCFADRCAVAPRVSEQSDYPGLSSRLRLDRHDRIDLGPRFSEARRDRRSRRERTCVGGKDSGFRSQDSGVLHSVPRLCHLMTPDFSETARFSEQQFFSNLHACSPIGCS